MDWEQIIIKKRVAVTIKYSLRLNQNMLIKSLTIFENIVLLSMCNISVNNNIKNKLCHFYNVDNSFIFSCFLK